jgi:uncharacterized protein (TIGR03067 family)
VEKPGPEKKFTQKEMDAAVAAGLKDLEGYWLFEKSQANGRNPWRLPEVGMYIERNLLRGVRKDGMLDTGGASTFIEIDPMKKPRRIEFKPRGVPGIYQLEGDQLSIAMNASEDNRDLYPGLFSVELRAQRQRASLVQMYQRVLREPSERPPAVAERKWTPKERAAAVAEALKKLQGQWILEKSETKSHCPWRFQGNRSTSKGTSCGPRARAASSPRTDRDRRSASTRPSAG